MSAVDRWQWIKVSGMSVVEVLGYEMVAPKPCPWYPQRGCFVNQLPMGGLQAALMSRSWWPNIELPSHQCSRAKDVECLVLFAIQCGSGLTGAFGALPQELSGIH